MSNYFRITAYNEKEDISIIIDSNGMFDKLWKFSSFLIQKGFKIIEVGNDESFIDGNISRAKHHTDVIILRAAQYGKPTYIDMELNGIIHKAVRVDKKEYILIKYITEKIRKLLQEN